MPLFRKSQPAPIAPDGGEAIPGYHDLQRIGRGGFSVVFRARQDQLDRVVALKVLSVEFIDAPVRKRFLREVQLTSRLTGHPNVVTVLDSGMTASGRPYIAMEYFERGSLRDRLAAEGPLPLADVLRIGVKVAGALGAAHQEGVLHRDVKPQNILVSRYGEPALADFGTARLTDALDVSSRTEALTPYHAAPEILQGQTPSPLCDVYSLGSTLYQLLAGRPPYRSEDGGIAALLLRVLQEDPPPITRADVPAEVSAAIARAMAKDPADRFADAWDVAYALQRVQLQLGLPLTELTNAPSLPADQRPRPTGPAVPPNATPPNATPPNAPPPNAPRPDPASPAAGAAAPEAPAGPRPPRPIPIELPGEFGDHGEGSTGGTHEYTTRDRTTEPSRVRLPDGPVAASARVGAPLSVGPAGPGDPGGPDGARGVTPAGERRRLRWPIAAGVGVLLVIAVAAPLAFAGHSGGPHPGGTAGPAATTGPAGVNPTVASPAAGDGSTGAPAQQPPAGQGDLARYRPTGLTVVVDGGTSVVLRWQPAPGTGDDNEFIRVDPQDPGRAPIVLAPGTVTYPVTGLNPATGYCFRVGPVVAIGPAGQDGTVAFSDATCIRGAVASPEPAG